MTKEEVKALIQEFVKDELPAIHEKLHIESGYHNPDSEESIKRHGLTEGWEKECKERGFPKDKWYNNDHRTII